MIIKYKTEYKLLVSSSAEMLSKEVNAYLDGGWVLHGTPFALAHVPAQAITKQVPA